MLHVQLRATFIIHSMISQTTMCLQLCAIVYCHIVLPVHLLNPHHSLTPILQVSSP
jgi:hypothetical protein